MTLRSPKSAAAALALAALIALPFAAAPIAGVAEEPKADEKPLDSVEDLITDEQREAIQRFLALAEPILERFQDLIESLPSYEAPVVLPNGDILIRRKRDVEVPNPDEKIDL